MKKQIILAIATLFISAAITAQTAEQERARNQSQTEAGSRKHAHEQTVVQTQGEYKNKGQMTKAQRHARNEERKALKRQQKEMKKQEAARKREQKMIQAENEAQDKEARKASPQGKGPKNSSGKGGGKR